MILDIFISAVIIVFLYFFIEFVAWLTHRYVMHGFLWILHEDLHQPRDREFQENDLFADFFSGIDIVLFPIGDIKGIFYLASMVIGVTLHGIGYILFHNIMFHRRIKGIRLGASILYFKRIANAHCFHHQNSTKCEGHAFELLFAPAPYKVD